MLMYFCYPNHVRVTFYNEIAIFLDLIKDKYFFLTHEMSSTLFFILNNKFHFDGDNYYPVSQDKSANSDINKTETINLNETIKHLLSEKLIQKTETFKSPKIRKKQSSGSTNLEWDIQTHKLHSSISKVLFLEIFLTLIKVNYFIKVKRFNKLIAYIKKLANKKACVNTSIDNLTMLVVALDKVCLFYPVKTKCLEWSATLVLLALSRGWKCNLVIGVQNFPFCAHAWVESNQKIVSDNANLQNDLAIILSEPYPEGP